MNEILTGESRKGKKMKAGQHTAHIPWNIFAAQVNTEIACLNGIQCSRMLQRRMPVEKQYCYGLIPLGREKGFSNEVRKEKDNPCSKSIHKLYPE